MATILDTSYSALVMSYGLSAQAAEFCLGLETPH